MSCLTFRKLTAFDERTGCGSLCHLVLRSSKSHCLATMITVETAEMEALQRVARKAMDRVKSLKGRSEHDLDLVPACHESIYRVVGGATFLAIKSPSTNS